MLYATWSARHALSIPIKNPTPQRIQLGLLHYSWHQEQIILWLALADITATTTENVGYVQPKNYSEYLPNLFVNGKLPTLVQSMRCKYVSQSFVGIARTVDKWQFSDNSDICGARSDPRMIPTRPEWPTGNGYLPQAVVKISQFLDFSDWTLLPEILNSCTFNY